MPLCDRKSADSIRRIVPSTKVPEFLTLFVGDGGAQVLHLDQALADEHDLRYLGNASHPGVANQLRIQRQQSLRFFRISDRTGLPLEQAACAIEFADSVDIGDEVVASGNRSSELDLKVPSRLMDLDTIVLAEPG